MLAINPWRNFLKQLHAIFIMIKESNNFSNVRLSETIKWFSLLLQCEYAVKSLFPDWG